jgi:hypothetical protein
MGYTGNERRSSQIIRSAGTEEILSSTSAVSQTGLTKWTECFDSVNPVRLLFVFFVVNTKSGKSNRGLRG